jgi:preprotein translocase subunit SecB
MASDVTGDAGPNEANGNDGENGSDNSGGAEPQAPMMNFGYQYIKDLSFENPRAPQIFQSNEQPEVGVNVNVGAERIADRTFEVVLRFAVTAKTKTDTIFVLELDYAGVCDIANVAEQDLQAVVLIEGPRILFPFARAIIANVTRDSGFPPLLISTVDFVEMYRSGLAEAQKQGEGVTTEA